MEEIEGIGDMEVVGVVATETGEIVVVAADMEVEGIEDMAVSYTHLTLPTICSV